MPPPIAQTVYGTKAIPDCFQTRDKHLHIGANPPHYLQGNCIGIRIDRFLAYRISQSNQFILNRNMLSGEVAFQVGWHIALYQRRRPRGAIRGAVCRFRPPR